jgi:hypothetical protein
MPRQIYEVPLHDNEVGVQCDNNAMRITTSIFFSNTINSERNTKQVLASFFLALYMIRRRCNCPYKK